MQFREYYQKFILKESPMRLGMSSDDILDNDALNQQEALDLIGSEPAPIDVVNLHNTIDLRVFRTEFESTIDYFVNKTPLIVAYFMYKITDGHMQMTGVWNRKQSKGMAFNLFFEYYLPKVKSITSDNKQTTQGERFWKRIIDEAEKRNKQIKAVINDREEIDLDDVNKFWGKLNDFYNYKIRIYN